MVQFSGATIRLTDLDGEFLYYSKSSGLWTAGGASGSGVTAMVATDGPNRTILYSRSIVGAHVFGDDTGSHEGAVRLNADNTRWITNASNVLYPTKSITRGGMVFELVRNGDLRGDGRVVWTKKADFTFDSQNRMIARDRADAGGWLGRSYGAFGTNGWQTLGATSRSGRSPPMASSTPSRPTASCSATVRCRGRTRATSRSTPRAG